MKAYRSADVHSASAVVIGAGVVGLTLARRLALLGVPDVVVLDAGTPGHQSTGRSSGGIRRQFGNPLEIEMSLASLRFYDAVIGDSEFRGAFSRIGYAFLTGERHLAELKAAWHLQQEMGLSVNWLEKDEVADRFPYLDTDGLIGGTFCADDGVIDPGRVIEWLLHRCEQLGVRVCANAPVDEIERDNRRVSAVRTGGQRIASPVVVNAAGAWAGRVGDMADVRIPVSPSPRFQAMAEIRSAVLDTPFTIDLESGAYMRVHRGAALTGIRPQRLPTGFDLTSDSDDPASIAARASRRFPVLRKARVIGGVSGLYEITPDGLPIAGGFDRLRGYYVAAGFNGHGIMHGPPVAEAVAELIAKGAADTFELSRLTPQRFSQDQYEAVSRVSSLF